MFSQSCNYGMQYRDLERSKKEILNDMRNCTGCHACYNACPVHAVKMIPDAEGFVYPVIEEEKCIGCDRCRKVCPILEKPLVYPKALAFAAFAKDSAEHMSSSSGGIFAVLARNILKKGGAVCVAAFDNQLQLRHILVETEEDLVKLKETKYVQSEIGAVYLEVKRVLLSGRQVLFSGTPCQVAGLKSFLGREYTNLLCVDLICHGVPSPKVFLRYLDELSDRPIVKMTFRDKTSGISKVTLKYETVDGTVIQEKYGDSPYIIGFIQNLFTRPSCFCCCFKGEKRTSDITIGDFWGIQEFHPSFATNQGTSAVIIHSDKGVQAFEAVREKARVKEATIDEIKAWNSCLIKSVDYNPKREAFFRMWSNKSVRDTVMDLRTEIKPEKKSFFRIMRERIKRWLV